MRNFNKYPIGKPQSYIDGLRETKLEIEESPGFRSAKIRLRLEYETIDLGVVCFPVLKSEPWEDVINYLFSNIELEEVEDE